MGLRKPGPTGWISIFFKLYGCQVNIFVESYCIFRDNFVYLPWSATYNSAVLTSLRGSMINSIGPTIFKTPILRVPLGHKSNHNFRIYFANLSKSNNSIILLALVSNILCTLEYQKWWKAICTLRFFADIRIFSCERLT